MITVITYKSDEDRDHNRNGRVLGIAATPTALAELIRTHRGEGVFFSYQDPSQTPLDLYHAMVVQLRATLNQYGEFEYQGEVLDLG